MSSAGFARATAPPARLSPARLRLRRSSEARPPLSRAAVAPSTAPSTLGLESVKNTRDLADAFDGVAPGRVFRTATPGGASAADAVAILDDLGVTALLDLRSEDEFEPDLGPVQSSFELLRFDRDDAQLRRAWASRAETAFAERRRVRFHAPLLDYDRYSAHIYENMSAWEKAQAVVYTAQAKLVDDANQRRLFVGKVNAGGLPLLNEVMLASSGEEIRAALEVVACVGGRGAAEAAGDRGGGALAFYCKAGKDRTGVVAALALKCCGASDAEVVADYRRSDAAGTAAALGGGRIERGLSIDYSRFRGAPREVMEGVLERIRREHGSVEKYLDRIGFDAVARARLARALCD